jgi:hypothetical protein
MPRGRTFEEGRAFERAAFLREVRRMFRVCEKSALIQKGTIMCVEDWLLRRIAKEEGRRAKPDRRK